MAAEDALMRLSLNLADVLQDRMFRRDVSFSFGLPHAIPGEKKPRLNIFLYQVNENPAFRNDEDPRRAVSGAFGSPPLALELGYLLTSYGADTAPDPKPAPALVGDSFAELDAQFILADAMRVFHDVPIITRKTQRDNPFPAPLLDPRLQTEFESLRISPRGLNLDELSKLWTALKEDFQRSVAYTVSVVRIERRRPVRAGGPVLSRTVTAQARVPIGPNLDRLDPDFAAAGESVTLVGSGVDDPSLQVFVSDALDGGFPSVPRQVPVIRDATGVHFQIPPADPNFLPGPKLVQLHVASSPNHTLGSNKVLFRLLPKILTVSPQMGPFDGTTTVTLQGMMMGRAPSPPPAGIPPAADPWTPTVIFGSYGIPVDDINSSLLPNTLSVRLQIPNASDPHAPKAGQVVPVRVRVNGVESQCWKTNSLTGQLEIDPAIQFQVQ